MGELLSAWALDSGVVWSRDHYRYMLYMQHSVQFSSVQSLTRVRLFATPWIAARQASLSITNSRSLLKLMSIESVMPSSHLILCRTLLLLPPIPPSIRGFSNESTLRIRWPKYWSFSFSFSISPSNKHPGLISRMDCTAWEIDGETVETMSDFIFWGSKITADGDCSHEIKRHLLLGRKAMTNLDSILKSRDITLPYPYMTTRKTIALTRGTFVGKVNM